jgi:predicted GNAT superfamily acetyltransferase
MNLAGIRFETIDGAPKHAYLDAILDLWMTVWPKEDLPYLRADVERRFGLLAVIAFNEREKIIGFKIGYEAGAGNFVSWIGAVDPEFRKRGVATRLMEIQHEAARGRGYKFVRTFTQNSSKPMLMLNLKNGFDVIGVYAGEDEPKILLQKNL